MCLTKIGNVLVAEEDIVCYKFLDRDGEFLVSPYYFKEYFIDELITSEFSFDRRWDSLACDMKPCIESGLHTFVNKQGVLDYVGVVIKMCAYDGKEYGPNVVIATCIIPKGSVYYLGGFGNNYAAYASDSLIMKEVENYNVV